MIDFQNSERDTKIFCMRRNLGMWGRSISSPTTSEVAVALTFRPGIGLARLPFWGRAQESAEKRVVLLLGWLLHVRHLTRNVGRKM